MTKILLTSLAEIESFEPCADGWRDILKGQGKTQADDVQFPLKNCLKSNSFSDVCWLLGKRKAEISIAIKAAKMCADSVAHIRNTFYADAAAYATYAANAANAAADAYEKQTQLNKTFLLQCIEEFENTAREN